MTATNKHLDEDALAELKLIMGEDFGQLITTFLKDSVMRIDALDQAINGEDPEAIRRAAHSFKGSAGNMAALQLADLCRSLEDMGHAGETAGSEALLQAITEEYQCVKHLLEQL